MFRKIAMFTLLRHEKRFSATKRGTVRLGTVSYCDEVATIWDGIKSYLIQNGVNFEFTLYPTYEKQVEALLSNHIDIAWNGPLAHTRLQKLVNPKNILSLGMRDCDRDFTSYILANKSSNLVMKSLNDIEGKRVAVGTYDSPQAYMAPFQHLIRNKINLASLDVIRYDYDIGKHGDTAKGEIEVLKALANHEVDVGFVSKLMYDRRDPSIDNAIGPLSTQLLADIKFDHCQFDAIFDDDSHLSITGDNNSSSNIPNNKAQEKLLQLLQFQKALLDMDWNDEHQRRLMQLEGIKRSWVAPREQGYAIMREAILTEETSLLSTPPLHTIDKHPFKSLTIHTS